VRIGLTIFQTDRVIGPVALAVAAEERGFHALYLPEHTHIPLSADRPGLAAGDEYPRTLDPFVALAAASTATSRILLGTGVTIPAAHDPIALAKTVATLDHLSHGRVVLGIGYGGSREELADHGVAWRTRREVTREHVLTMRSLWRDDVASYAGEHVDLSPSRAWPKPARLPRVLIGGAPTPTLFAHVAEFGDGWMPIGGRAIEAALPALRAAVEGAGRDFATIDVIPFGCLPDPEKLARYRDSGCTEIVLRLPNAGPEEVLPALDAYAKHL